MKEQKKKQLIAILLFVACIISGYLFINTPGAGVLKLQSLAQADTLIMEELDNFNIADDQIRVVTTRVDSNFSRKTYWVRVPPQFSKTQLHAELNKTFHQYSVSTPAKVIFPHKDINIHLQLNDTIIRTIKLQSDPSLTISKKRASLLLVFDDIPDGDLLSELKSLGEPFYLVLKVENPIQANQFRDELTRKYSRVIYWLQHHGGNMPEVRAHEVRAVLKQMKEIMPEETFLYLPDSNNLSTDSNHRLFTQSGLQLVLLQNPVIFENNLGKSAFIDKLDTFAHQASTQDHPVALVMADKSVINWIKERLPILKKNGLDFVPPPTID